MKTIFKITIFSLIVFFTACKPAQKIVYNVNKYKPASDWVNASLSIQTFQDIRQEFPENQPQLQAKDNVAKVDNQKSCINAEKLYKVPVGLQLANMLCTYLNKKAYFTNVLVNQKEQTNYYLTATVKYFAGNQKYSTKAAVGSQFGLIGALATMNLKTEGKIIIELSDICLHDKTGNLVAKIGDLKKEYEGDFPVDANCYCIYQNVNQSLAEFNEELGTILFQEIAKLK